MRKRVNKAPSLGVDAMMNVAIAATRLANEAGFVDLVAVPAKRTVQWRVRFKTDTRKKNAFKRQYDKIGSLETYSVSKWVVYNRVTDAGKSYDELMSKAYAEAGMVFKPTYPTGEAPAPKVKAVKEKSVKVKAKKPEKVKADKQVTVKPKTVKKAKAASPVTEKELEDLLDEMLA